MQTFSDRIGRLIPLILGVATLAGVVLLFVDDAAPRLFPVGSHDTLAAFSLVAIACAYVVFELAHHRSAAQLVKAILLAAAFLFWAANQFWPNLPEASLFNDIAIGLFVLDVFLVIAGWPPGANDDVLDDCGNGAKGCSCGCQTCLRAQGDVPEVEAGRHFSRDEMNER
ncbi:MAG: hypothetical protein ABSD59_01185 [Terracidiphilus sp.]